jgi:glycosyltransferase involved in cell wall biosynthesis
MGKIKILNLAFTDMGGAGKASLLFNEMFNNAGYESILVVKESNECNENVIVLPQKVKNQFLKFFNKQLRRFKYIISYYILFDEKYFFFNKNENKSETKVESLVKAISFVPDVIVLHWITGFVNSKIINELERITNAKMIWIMMDNAPLTGGCHYPWDCEGFYNSCSNCPAIKLPFLKQIAKSNLRIKKQNISLNLEVISCSSTDYERAIKSSVFKKNKIHKILFPIDKDKFSVGNKNLSKNKLSIQNDKKIIFYGASSIANTRKGLLYFLKALSILEDKIIENEGSYDSYVILIAGNIDVSNFSEIKIPIVMLGFLNEEDLINAYQASEVFVSTSIEDSGPLMVNQSIMTGTPVVSFNIGVAVDLVQSEFTGYLSELYDTKSMANNIYKILSTNDLEYNKMCDNCRQMAIDMYSFENSIKSYSAIFSDKN